MTVKELTNISDFRAVSLPNPQRTISGAYASDLISWVMGRAKEGDAWLTIMSNINVIAVATLSDVSCVILTEGVALDETLLDTATEKGVNIISTVLTTYEASIKLAEALR